MGLKEDYQQISRSRMAMAGFLRFLLKVTNFLLILVGIGMMAFSGYMYKQFADAHFHGNTPPAPPSMLGGDGDDNPSKAPEPWFIYAIGAAGAWTTLTALAGLCGASHGSRACLNLYSFMLFLMLLLQGGFAVALFADKSWLDRIPKDETGKEQEIKDFIEKKLNIAKYVGVGALGLQIVSVVLACALKKAGPDSGLDSDDEDDFSSSRRRPLMPRSDDSAPPPTDEFSQRMRDKYGLDTRDFSYKADRKSTVEEKEKSCVIM